MRDRAKLTEAKIGLFVLSALAVLVAGSLWIAGSTFFGAPRESYTIHLRNSGGVETGDRVRMAGVKIGKVRSVTLRPAEEWPVLLEVKIKPGVSIRTDSTARITSAGVLGASFLQVDPGSPEAPELAPGGDIYGVSGTGGLDGAMARVGEISEKVARLLDQTSGVLDQISGELDPLMTRVKALMSEQNAENVGRMLASMRKTAEVTGPRVTALLDRLDALVGSAEQGLDDLPEITSNVDGLIEDLRQALGSDGARLAALLERAESTLTSAEDVLTVVGENRGELAATLENLHDTMVNLRVFSQTVKERPYSLVRIRNPSDRRPGDGID